MAMFSEDKKSKWVFEYRTPNGGVVVRCGKFTIMDEAALEYLDPKDWVPIHRDTETRPPPPKCRRAKAPQGLPTQRGHTVASVGMSWLGKADIAISRQSVIADIRIADPRMSGQSHASVRYG